MSIRRLESFLRKESGVWAASGLGQQRPCGSLTVLHRVTQILLEKKKNLSYTEPGRERETKRVKRKDQKEGKERGRDKEETGQESRGETAPTRKGLFSGEGWV